MKQLIKSITEICPLAIFLIYYLNQDLMAAIFPFIIASVITLPLLFIIDKKIPIFAIISTVIIIIFGIISIYFNNEGIFKMKPTFLYLATSIGLLISLRFNKIILKNLLSTSIQMNNRGWKIATKRWSYFFIFLAFTNEIIWRTQPTQTWVTFKVFGVLILMFIFSLLQISLIKKYTEK